MRGKSMAGKAVLAGPGSVTMAAITVSATLILGSLCAWAQAPAAPATTDLQTDQQAFCDYTTEQAAAQRDLLLTPSAEAGVTQPNTGQPMQLVWGLTSSLSDIRKAGLTMDVARRNCDLYSATTAAQQNIQYALPSLEKKALENRVGLIQQASGKLDALIADTSKMVEAQDATRPMLFALETTKIKLNADLADTQSKIAALYTPLLLDAPLKELVAEKQTREAEEQNAIDKLARQNNWDVSLSIGAHQQINPLMDNSGPYGAVTVSYNLGSHAINKHLDKAAGAYAAWKNVQQGDVARNAAILKKQATEAGAAQAARLKSLQDQQKLVESNLKLVEDANTAAALDFRNQLTSALLLLGIEIGDAAFRVDQLQAFLNSNF
jgi:hypothetical protein